MKRRIIELEKMQNDDVDAALKELDEQVELRGLEQLDAKAAAEAATEAQNKQKREYEARLASIRNTLQNTQRQLEEEQRTSAGMKGEARTRFDTFVQDIERITGEKESITDAKVCEPLLASNERQRRLGSRMTSTMRRSSPRSYNPRWIALTH